MNARQSPLRDAYQLLVDCRNEETQRRVYEQLKQQGHACRVLTRLGIQEHQKPTADPTPAGDGGKKDV